MEASLFRAMEPAADGFPKTGPDRNMLGARPSVDMRNAPKDAEGNILAGPGRGGPSVSVDDWRRMPATIRPKAFGGINSLNVMYRAPFTVLAPAQLALGDVNERTKHAVIEASDECTLAVFQARLASTRSAWAATPAEAALEEKKP